MNKHNRGFIRWMVVFILAFILVMPGMGQQKMNEAAKKKEKIERSYKKSYAKARKKTIKHRRAIQTDATKERMDKVDNRARENNRQNDPGFIERYFKKKRPPKK